MEGAVAREQSNAAGVRSRELDSGFDTFASRTREEHLGEHAARQLAKSLRQFARQFGDVTLQHYRPRLVQFIFEGGHDRWVIVARIMDRVAGKKIEDSKAVRGEQFRSHAAFIAEVHFEQAEQLDPVGIHVVSITICGETFSDWHGKRLRIWCIRRSASYRVTPLHELGGDFLAVMRRVAALVASSSLNP